MEASWLLGAGAQQEHHVVVQVVCSVDNAWYQLAVPRPQRTRNMQLPLHCTFSDKASRQMLLCALCAASSSGCRIAVPQLELWQLAHGLHMIDEKQQRHCNSFFIRLVSVIGSVTPAVPDELSGGNQRC